MLETVKRLKALLEAVELKQGILNGTNQLTINKNVIADIIRNGDKSVREDIEAIIKSHLDSMTEDLRAYAYELHKSEIKQLTGLINEIND